MPCYLGYRSIITLNLPIEQPETLREETKASSIDRELMDKIGEPEFLQWLAGLDIQPLLGEALKRALAKVKTDGIKFALKGQFLQAEGTYVGQKQKGKMQAVINRVFSQFQMEILGIVAQLLDYEVVMFIENNTVVLEGEKMEDSGVHKYLRISKSRNGETEIKFEHFTSLPELEKEEAKFFALAQKMGIKINVRSKERSGQPISQGSYHQGFLKERN